MCDRLRKAVIQHLEAIYWFDIEAASSQPIPEAPPGVAPENAQNHALIALEMGRLNAIPSILPLTFYYAACIPPADLRTVYPALSPETERLIHIGRAQLVESVVEHALAWLCAPEAMQPCGSDSGISGSCRAKRLAAVSRALKGSATAARIFLNSTPLDVAKKSSGNHQGLPVQLQSGSDSGLCVNCSRVWSKAQSTGFCKVWEDMPAFFGVADPSLVWPKPTPVRESDGIYIAVRPWS